MSVTMYLVFNHRFTTGQEAAARGQLGVGRFAPLPPDLRDLWGQVPPDLPELLPYLAPLRQWLAAQAARGDYVLVQGDFGATYLMVRFCLEQGLIPIYATTRREAREEHRPDGSVRMSHRFQHQMFRQYGV